MNSELRSELRELLPAWWLCPDLPVPMILFWHSVEGRSKALMAFFLGCVALAAFSFRPGAIHRAWRTKISALAVALLAAFAVFSALVLAFNNPTDTEEQAIWWRSSWFEKPRDLIAPMLALMALVPSLTVVPYLTLSTRRPFAAVVFSLLLVGCMKFLGAIVVVLVYGWDAAEKGHTTMPWNRPDLLVWLFWGNCAVLSATCYVLAARRFRVRRN